MTPSLSGKVKCKLRGKRYQIDQVNGYFPGYVKSREAFTFHVVMSGARF
jgi:hypothetical protein